MVSIRQFLISIIQIMYMKVIKLHFSFNNNFKVSLLVQVLVFSEHGSYLNYLVTLQLLYPHCPSLWPWGWIASLWPWGQIAMPSSDSAPWWVQFFIHFPLQSHNKPLGGKYKAIFVILLFVYAGGCYLIWWKELNYMCK